MSNNTNTPEVNIPENSPGTEITSPFPKIIGLDVLEHFTVKIKDYINSLLGNKQDKLTDNNLKKINNESLIGEGNISIVSSPISLVDTDFESIDDINSSGIGNINLSTQAQILPYKFMNNSVYEQLIPFEEIVNCNIEIENPLFITADLIGTNKCKPVSIKNYLNNIIELEDEITDIWDYLKIVYTGKKIDYSKEYFTIKSLEDGLTVTLSRNASQYRIDNGEWADLAADTATPSINNGQKVSFKITNPILSRRDSIGTFTINKKCNVSGNIMSLFYGDDFEGHTDLSGKDYVFSQLFYNCRTLQSAENLILPATTLASYCYDGMFGQCTNLVKAPKLPATELESHCYTYMFTGCTSLTKAPKLPATTLAPGCYSNMFEGCTSLTAAPELPATTLAQGCYDSMFSYCASLTEVPHLPATTLASSCYQYMFYSCTSLTEAPELPATTLALGCYYQMFYSCTSLTEAPELPATTLANACYAGMFSNCTSLETAPILPAITLVSACYETMFNGCNKLNNITMLATDISADNCLTNWVDSVASSGTFVKNAAMTTLPSGTSGIPEGWTIEDYVETE